MSWQKRLEDAERRAERMKRADAAPSTNLIVIDSADEPQGRAAHDENGRPLKILAGIDLADL